MEIRPLLIVMRKWDSRFLLKPASGCNYYSDESFYSTSLCDKRGSRGEVEGEEEEEEEIS